MHFAFGIKACDHGVLCFATTTASCGIFTSCLCLGDAPYGTNILGGESEQAFPNAVYYSSHFPKIMQMMPFISLPNPLSGDAPRFKMKEHLLFTHVQSAFIASDLSERPQRWARSPARAGCSALKRHHVDIVFVVESKCRQIMKFPSCTLSEFMAGEGKRSIRSEEGGGKPPIERVWR